MLKHYLDPVSINISKNVAYVNVGKKADLDGGDIGLVIRNLVANAIGNVKIKCHTVAAGKNLGSLFTADEFLELVDTYPPILRIGYTNFKNGGGMPSPYMSLMAPEVADKPKAKAKPKAGDAIVVD